MAAQVSLASSPSLPLCLIDHDFALPPTTPTLLPTFLPCETDPPDSLASPLSIGYPLQPPSTFNRVSYSETQKSHHFPNFKIRELCFHEKTPHSDPFSDLSSDRVLSCFSGSLPKILFLAAVKREREDSSVKMAEGGNKGRVSKGGIARAKVCLPGWMNHIPRCEKTGASSIRCLC